MKKFHRTVLLLLLYYCIIVLVFNMHKQITIQVLFQVKIALPHYSSLEPQVRHNSYLYEYIFIYSIINNFDSHRTKNFLLSFLDVKLSDAKGSFIYQLIF